jgi:hypothetical protein
MDFASLKEQVSNLTLYDIKAGVRKVQNGKLINRCQFGFTLGEFEEEDLLECVY